jgi:hypothetical protein
VSPIVVRGADELAAKTGRMAERLRNPAGAAPRLQDILRARIKARFDADGEGDWAPLSEATVARWGEHPILRRTGALEAALLAGTAQAAGSEIRYAPDVPFYGALVNEDRPVMPAGDDELAGQAAEAIAEHVMGGET